MRKKVLLFTVCLGFFSSSPHILAKPEQNKQGFAVTRELSYEVLSGEEEKPAYSGIVSETFQAGGYSYIRFKTEDKEYWAATNAMPLNVGDEIVLGEVYPMHGFHSKSLDRTFDLILFTSNVSKKTQVAR